MAAQHEIDAAADRLRRYRNGVKNIKEYQSGEHAWTRDNRVVADAYLALGTRQPDENRTFADGRLWNTELIDDMFREDFPDAKLVRVVTFIQEIEQ